MEADPVSHRRISAPESSPRRLSSATRNPPSARKRSITASSPSEPSPGGGNGQRKAKKVSRACDFCKSRKARCSGNQPCDKCVAKGRDCLFDAKYTRGRPPTPPRSEDPSRSSIGNCEGAFNDDSREFRAASGSRAILSADMEPARPHHIHESTAPSRASPELGMAEIQGQVFDPTSGLTFLHRAWKRLSAQNTNSISDEVKTSAEEQPITMAGDKPLPEKSQYAPLQLPEPAEARRLLAMYFDVCIATYRFLHRPTVEGWLAVLERNVMEHLPICHEIGRAKAAIVLLALAIATTHNENSKGFFSADDEARALSLSDELFQVASRLTDSETGYPRTESAQARLIQVLYLLTTSRFNRAWFIFGDALQIVSALGLHRRASSKRRRVSRTDYIDTQCGLRTFWTAYILDNYLGVVFGRPRHFHDEDIDQDFPDRVNDEDMTALGPAGDVESGPACHIDALILHAKIGQIIGCISREVYSIRDISEHERVAAAHRLIQRVHEWQASLPLHLGSIKPSLLIASYRRQATVLKLAHSHAILHASRLFLLGNSPSMYEDQVGDCIAAARAVLETVDGMAKEGPIFHAFWWTHYVTFCALVVVHVWEIQQRRTGRTAGAHDRASLLDLAERCQTHLSKATATNSPSRRYAVILEEFRNAASSQPPARPAAYATDGVSLPAVVHANGTTDTARLGQHGAATQGMEPFQTADQTMSYDTHILDEWQTTDWLELDSSAFWPHVDMDDAVLWPHVGSG